MSNNNNEDNKNKSAPIRFDVMSTQNKALFKLAIEKSMESKIRKIDLEIEDVEAPHPSIRHKIRMNRLFREHNGGRFIPFPEADDFGDNESSKT